VLAGFDEAGLVYFDGDADLVNFPHFARAHAGGGRRGA
jgi:hypothetical protein